MQQTGAAVLNGVLSTLIAALCLSGSKSYVFLTFFYALIFIVLCGAFQGLIVLPVLLDFFRPTLHTIEPAAEASNVSDSSRSSEQKNEKAEAESAPAGAHANELV